MTIDELRRFFARVTYLPGWTFDVVEDRFEGPHLHIRCGVVNAYQPTATAKLNIISPLPPLESDRQAADWLRWRLSRIATHEVREWLLVDGVRPFDPHDGVVRT